MKKQQSRRIVKTSGFHIPIEYSFLVIGFVFGLMLVYANPPWQTNDEDRHFYNAYLNSVGVFTPQQNGDLSGAYLPATLLRITESFQGIPYRDGQKLKHDIIQSSASMPLMETEKTFYPHPGAGANPFPYAPFILGIWISKAINSNPIHLQWGARIAGLITFLVFVFFAIRIIPIHKYVLFALALSPMTLFQAASVTYDVLCMSFSFLVFALAVRYTFKEGIVTLRELLIFVLFAAFLHYAKSGYVFIPFLLFMIPPSRFGSWKTYILIMLLLALCYFLPGYTWGKYIASLHLPGGRPFQNDFLYNGDLNQQFLFRDPLHFVSLLFLNVLAQGKEWIIGAFGRFGYSYVHMTESVIFIHVLALIFLSVFDTSKQYFLSARQKIFIGLLAFGNIFGIIASFLLGISPVGSSFVFGLQGRYFIPILPLVFLLCYNSKISSAFWDKWKNALVPLYSILILAYTVFFIRDYFYL
jgi:uncharacterized membrane protein